MFQRGQLRAQALRPIPAPFRRFGGFVLPKLKCALSVGHAFVGPVNFDINPKDHTNRFVNIDYRRLKSDEGCPSEDFQHVYVHRDFFAGGADVAIMSKNRMTSDRFEELHAELRKMSDRNIAKHFSEPHPLMVKHPKHGGHQGLATYVADHKNIRVNDIGFPGLSGSPAFLKVENKNRFLGLYTARLPSTDESTRAAKILQVVLMCRENLELPIDVPIAGHHLGKFPAASRARRFKSPSSLARAKKMSVREMFWLMRSDIIHLRGDMNEKMIQLNDKVERLNHKIETNISDVLRRRAIVLPWEMWCDSHANFVEVPRGFKKVVSAAPRIHAFDSVTDVDFGTE